MVTAHIHTPGFTTAGGTALLTPIHRFANALARRGIQWRVFSRPTRDLVKCDVLIVDSEMYKSNEQATVLEALERFRERVPKVVWADTGVSTGMLQNWVLPYVHAYWKGQALKDRNLYLRPMYGGRYFTDYYHRYLGIDDAEGQVWPGVDDVSQLKKIRVSWNAAFVDHTVAEPAWAGPSRGNGRAHVIPAPRLLGRPDQSRPVGVSARLGRDYPEATLSYQRERIRQQLAGKVPTEPVDRMTYLDEIQDAKVVVAPFGVGEITPRDFEAFSAGALLLKPVMNIVDTWPPLYTENFTFWAHNWRVDYLDYLVNGMLEEYHKVVEVAQLGQDRYLGYVRGRRAAELFAKRFLGLLTQP